MWLNRNTKVLDSFPHKNGNSIPVLYDQVTQCLGSLTISLICATSEWFPQHTRQESYGSHMIAGVHNISCVNCCTCTYFFWKQTASFLLIKFVSNLLDPWPRSEGSCKIGLSFLPFVLRSVLQCVHKFSWNWPSFFWKLAWC